MMMIRIFIRVCSITPRTPRCTTVKVIFEYSKKGSGHLLLYSYFYLWCYAHHRISLRYRSRIPFHSISLAFPPLATFQACNKCRHWLIRRPCLKLVIRALFRFTLIACEIVRRSLNVRFVFLFIANLLVLNKFLPFVRAHLLM